MSNRSSKVAFATNVFGLDAGQKIEVQMLKLAQMTNKITNFEDSMEVLPCVQTPVSGSYFS